MECTCGSTNKPWPELKLLIPAAASEEDEKRLVAVLAEVNGVRGVQVDTATRQATVCFNNDLVDELLLKEAIEKTGCSILTDERT